MHQAREQRDQAIDSLRRKMMKKIDTKEQQLERAMASLDREKNESDSAKVQAGVTIVGSLLGALFSRKKFSSSNVAKGKSAVSSASRAMKQGQDVKLAESKVASLQRDCDQLHNELLQEVTRIEQSYEPAALELETESIKPYKKDIVISYVGVLWVPYDDRGDLAC